MIKAVKKNYFLYNSVRAIPQHVYSMRGCTDKHRNCIRCKCNDGISTDYVHICHHHGCTIRTDHIRKEFPHPAISGKYHKDHDCVSRHQKRRFKLYDHNERRCRLGHRPQQFPYRARCRRRDQYVGCTLRRHAHVCK